MKIVNAEKYKANPNKFKDRTAAEYAANPDKIRARQAAWSKAHPQQAVASAHRRRARIAGVEGRFTVEQFESLVIKYGNTCLRCRRTGVKLTADHVVPIFYGGSNYIENIQPLCKPCNSSKGVKTIDYRITYKGIEELNA